MQHARIACRIEIGVGAVQQAPIVPHQKVAGAPFVPINKPRLRGMFFQCRQTGTAFGHRSAFQV